MATIRVTLKSMGYPAVAPNCLVVLQSLMAVGFKVVLRDSFYRDKEAILNYFDDLNIPVSFTPVKDPEIDILQNSIKVFLTWNRTVSWDMVDKMCLSQGIYSRNSRYSYVPTYKRNTYFIVLGYGEKTQVVDSTPIQYSTAKHRARSLVAEDKAKDITLVEADTLRIAGVYAKDGYTDFLETIYFNNEL